MKRLNRFFAWGALLALAVFLPIGLSATTLTIPAPVYTATNGTTTVNAFGPMVIHSTDTDSFFPYYQAAFNSWNSSLAAGSQWTLVNGQPLSADANFTLTTYQAYLTTNSPDYGGVEILINYTAGTGDPPRINADGDTSWQSNEAVWSQAIYTDVKRVGSLPGDPYLDGFYTSTYFNPPLYPYQYTNSQFYDKPSRSAPATWIGMTYLATANYSTRTETIYDGVAYGFEIVTPEPCSILLLSGGGVLVIIKRVRRKARN